MPEEIPDDLEPGSELSRELIEFAKLGDTAKCKALLSDGAMLGYIDEVSGWSALVWASSEGHAETVGMLLQSGAFEAEQQVVIDGMAPKACTSPLHWAAFKGHVHVVWQLLVAGFSPTALDTEKNTALHLAATGGHILILKTLLSEGVSVSAKNMYGNTALSLTTSAECQKLLRTAAIAADDGRFYLCSCSSEFFSNEKSVAAQVIDRVSAPSLRPVRYSSECAARIKAAEDQLTAAVKAADTEALQAALSEAEEIGTSVLLLDSATDALQRLQAQIALQEQITQINQLRPLAERLQLRPLLLPLKQARERGVNASLIDSADRLCQAVAAEVELQACEAASRSLCMPEIEEGATIIAATSGFASRCETGIAKLDGGITTAQSVEALEAVVSSAQQLHRRLVGESDLRKSLLETKESTAEDGSIVYTHYNGTKTASVLEMLQLRNDMLDSAFDKCTVEGTAASVLTEAAKAQKDLKAKLKQAVADDEERKAKEAAAAAKAAKKKKGGNKKG